MIHSSIRVEFMKPYSGHQGPHCNYDLTKQILFWLKKILLKNIFRRVKLFLRVILNDSCFIFVKRNNCHFTCKLGKKNLLKLQWLENLKGPKIGKILYSFSSHWDNYCTHGG